MAKNSLGTLTYIPKSGPPRSGVVLGNNFVLVGTNVFGKTDFLNNRLHSPYFTNACQGLALGKGIIVSLQMIIKWSYEQSSHKTDKPIHLWRQMDHFLEILHVLTGMTCPSDTAFPDLAEDFIINELEDELPKDSACSTAALWEVCSQKAKAFMTSPEIQQILAKEPPLKRQNIVLDE